MVTNNFVTIQNNITVVNVFTFCEQRPLKRNFRTDNHVFRLHFQTTNYILATLTLLIMIMNFFGDTNDCTVNGTPDHDGYYSDHATFTGPGKSKVRYRGYDKMMGVVLLQRLLFLAPGYVQWILENVRIRTLVQLGGFTMGAEANVDELVNFLMNVRLCLHTAYALEFFVGETLNLINVGIQIWYFNDILRSTVGQHVFDELRLLADSDDRVPSGASIQSDAVCNLPGIIGWIKLFFSFGYILMTVLSIFKTLFRIATFLSARLRMMLLRTRVPEICPIDAKTVISKLSTVRWLFLEFLFQNVHPVVFSQTVSMLAIKLDNVQRV